MVTIHVCVGSACHLRGSYSLINKFQELISEGGFEEAIELRAAFCLGNCTKPVSVRVNDGPVISVEEDTIQDFFNDTVARGLK